MASTIYGFATDGEGNVYISGSTGDVETFALDAFVAKYSAAGALLWVRQLGTSEEDASLGIATDRDWNVYISGYSKGIR